MLEEAESLSKTPGFYDIPQKPMLIIQARSFAGAAGSIVFTGRIAFYCP